MTIKIVTDSTCDLPDEIAAEHDVTVVPMYVNFGGKSYLDGVDLSREAFYEQLPDCDPPPTTAIPGPQAFLNAYQRLADKGATQILSVHISKSLSGVVDTASLAAREASMPVTVFDAGTLSLGLGFLARTAAQAAAAGRSMQEIVARLGEQRQRTHVFAALDTLEFLRRGGRVSRLVATLGSWLKTKPLLKMHDGTARAERIRTTKAAFERLMVLLREQLPLESVALVHTHALEKAKELRLRAQDLLPNKEILSVDVTPLFGAHLGPEAVGFVCVGARGSAE